MFLFDTFVDLGQGHETGAAEVAADLVTAADAAGRMTRRGAAAALATGKGPAAGLAGPGVLPKTGKPAGAPGVGPQITRNVVRLASLGKF